MTMYKKWASNPIQFLALTSYTVTDLLALMHNFNETHNNYFPNLSYLEKGKGVP